MPNPKSEVRSSRFEAGDVGCSSLCAILHPPSSSLVFPLLLLALTAAAGAESKSAAIPLSEIGAKATADYQGDALGVVATAEGARLKCGFQKLEGRATAEGLWLESCAGGGDKFRLVATAVSRAEPGRASVPASPNVPGNQGFSRGRSPSQLGPTLASTGKVCVADKVVRFTRPGLVEEYSVSVDGVRQDFVVTERLTGAGELRVELGLSGARAEAAVHGAKLTVEGSGRELAYSRLRAVNGTGKELPARMEVLSADRLAVVVDDAEAVYPVRIDPTFSDADWVSISPSIPGTDGSIAAVVVDESGNLCIGGGFTIVGGVMAKGIAKWDGNHWSELGGGVSNLNAGVVYALAVSGSNLYVGGQFHAAGGVEAHHVARWDGSTWSPLGSGMSGGLPYQTCVRALAVSGTSLYAGGYFSAAGGTEASHIAKWDGSGWSPLGSGMDFKVWALAASDTNVYAGGEFTMAGGSAANCIAKWDGSNWSPLGSGMDRYGYVYALAVSGGDLYAGGEFMTAGGLQASHIAKWDGSSWSPLGSGMASAEYPGVHALAVSGGELYAGGRFMLADGGTANGIAKWDGSHWSALGSGMGPAEWPYDCNVAALALSGSNVYAGGWFTTAGEAVAKSVAKWDGSNWTALASGINDSVTALAVSGGNVYAAGDFTTTDAGAANHIAKWNGSAWSPLASGIDGSVTALAASGIDLYAGGWFTNAGGTAANCIAKWNGSNWSALASGMNDSVMALALSGGNLYAGGRFTTAGGTAAHYIAEWDGSSWSPLSSGMDGPVHMLSASGSDLYAGGGFTTAGGNPANGIAKWDGSSWSPLGSGVDGTVQALAVSGTNVYVAGLFRSAGNLIAKWDGSRFVGIARMVGGDYPDVHTLTVSGNELYAGGSFLGIEWTVGASYIVKWDGSTWSPLGSGVNWDVNAVVADGLGHLFVGGAFSLAGTNVSPFIAQANIGPCPGRLGRPSFSPLNGFSLNFCQGKNGQDYRIETSPSLAPGSWTDLTNFTYSGPTAINDPAAVSAPKKFYRAVSP